MSETLSDAELMRCFSAIYNENDWIVYVREATAAIESHIEALARERDNARNIAVSLENELAELRHGLSTEADQ